MVDCGSMNNKLRNPEMEMTGVFSFLRERYRPIYDRTFLLTHYHRDHLWGFQHITKQDPRYFSRVFLPYIPLDEKEDIPLLKLSLYAFALASPQTDLSQVNTACVTLPIKLIEELGAENVRFLKEGDRFDFDSVEYTVLNPKRSSTFDSVLYEVLSDLEENYSGLAEKIGCFCGFYKELQESPDLKLAEKLNKLTEELRELKVSSEADGIFSDQSFLRAFSSAVNNESVVFHNSVPSGGIGDILMTGDISAERFDCLFPDFHSAYYAVKAPHHGTAGGFSTRLLELEPEHILIHNDEYKPELTIALPYTNLESIRHCTGNLSCEYFREYGSCCNRLSRCYNFGRGTELAFRCPDIRSRGRLPGCKVYVVTPARGRSCFCD